jgi:phosphopantothenoylcysteine decarboxylase/phosphopantothenate--cysteine ligase
MLTGMQVVIGVTGGIAAYKIPLLVRSLVKEGAAVRVVMTRHAEKFVSPLTLRTLSGNPVLSRMFDADGGPSMAHIEWPREADLMVIAPATANFIGKMAHGIADDLLSTMVLTLNTPLLIVPSMNTRMYNHPAVVQNLAILRERGIHILDAETGDLACGEEGAGRMAEVDEIVHAARALLVPSGPLSGKRVIVTAGPTLEPIDPVRYIGNRSSGKMGYAVAAEAQRRGAAVTLVSGPSGLEPPGGVKIVRVTTALEMREALLARFAETDVLIMAAAVGDYRVVDPAPEKIKKGPVTRSLELTANPDILQELSRRRDRQVLVGFAAETDHLEAEARRKLSEKGLDLLVANDVSKPDSGFDADNNRVLILDRLGGMEKTDLVPKGEVAGRLLDRLSEAFL